MTGYRREDYYLSRYGLVEGAVKFEKTLERREKRNRRQKQDRNLKLGSDLEHEIQIGNAIRCLACGYIGTRLQWTHFARKCSVKTIQEYKTVFPDAEVVAPNLKLRTSMTLDNIVAVYGETEGQTRWKNYCDKQALTNTLDYKAKKYGWDQSAFNDYNSSRAVTLKNLVDRHGQEEGEALWSCYCERQKYTNTLAYFIEREGSQDVGLEKWLKYNDEKGKSRRVPDIAKALNISLDEASIVLAARTGSSKTISDGERIFVSTLNTALENAIKYTCETRQFCIWSAEANQPFFYDICCTKRKKIVEYNGDYWHARPTRYGSDFVVKKRDMTAEEVWEFDRIKHETAKLRGFDVYVVWETDFLRDGLSKELIEWLNYQAS